MWLFIVRTSDDESHATDTSHEEVYNVFIMKTKTKPKTAFFSAKPTETARQETFLNCKNATNQPASNSP